MISYIIQAKCSPASTPTTTPVYITLKVPPLVSEEKMDWRALVKDGSPQMATDFHQLGPSGPSWS